MDAASKDGGPVSGLRIVESSAFIAMPSAMMSLALLGAEVLRIDPPGGGLDYRRWPLAPSGQSLYWTFLNRGKRSLTLDLRREEGREAAARLVCDGGEDGGIFVTNLPLKGALGFEALRARRSDVIVVSLDGSPDGETAVDYTVHAGCGAAMMAGPRDHTAPVNNAVPFWDLICGQTIAMGLLAAERERRQSGRGQHVRISLSDVAMAGVAGVGMLAEAELGQARQRDGNWVYGNFGRDFGTLDGRRLMLAAVTEKQWRALLSATGLGSRMDALATAFDADFSREDERYRVREAIGALVADWVGTRTLEQVADAFSNTPVCWGPYRDLDQMLREDWRASEMNPLFSRRGHPGVDPVLTPRSPLRFSNHPDMANPPAPEFGADCAE
nr:CoA transferase [Pararhodobacter sp. SW119]